jgi:hypothetical protein
VENHNAEIFALNLREWFSTGFLTPVISTALRMFSPFLRYHPTFDGSLYAFVARRFVSDGPVFRRESADFQHAT